MLFDTTLHRSLFVVLRGAAAPGESANRGLPRAFRQDDGVVPIWIQGLLDELSVCTTGKRLPQGCHLFDGFAPVYGDSELLLVSCQNRKTNRVDCLERGPLIGVSKDARTTGKASPAEPIGRMGVCGQLRLSQTIKVRHRQLMSATLKGNAMAPSPMLQGRAWHSSQKVTPLPGGGSHMRFRLSALEEVERWILSWGTHASVIGPAELRKRVARTARTVGARYEDAGI